MLPQNQMHLCAPLTPSKFLNLFTQATLSSHTHRQWKNSLNMNEWPLQLPLQHPIVRLKSGRLAVLLTENQTHLWHHGPLPSSKSLDLSSLPIPMDSGQTPWTKIANSTSVAAPHRAAEICAIWHWHCSLAPSESNTFMEPWTPSKLASKSLDLFTHICPPFLYP